jgi:hypothetical protein
MASTTPLGSKPELIAWESMAVSTELTRRRRPPMGRERPLQPARRMSLLAITGAKSESHSLCVDRGRPRYVCGKEETSHPKEEAMEAAMAGSV